MTRETTPSIATRLLPGPRTLLRDSEQYSQLVKLAMPVLVMMEKDRPQFQMCKI